MTNIMMPARAKLTSSNLMPTWVIQTKTKEHFMKQSADVPNTLMRSAFFNTLNHSADSNTLIHTADSNNLRLADIYKLS